ncbi:hypothetical protein [Raineyella sp. LH-20]|uniref:hypothetical protein n=1 Tax=Raineyella sp. LH-20 TaxID=3081204 RepID=UPI002954329D|nr:hypothetical protein [Raineyella sp. LH-20]WOP17586.1 hypothetical protein R0146_09905 [Raineyella sp. LH-20]
MTVARVGRAIVVIVPDRPGHWPDNPALLGRLAGALAGSGAPPVRIEVVDRTLLEIVGRDGTRRHRVSASHEAGRVGLAVSPASPADRDGGIGFDLCAEGRGDSIRSALPLVLTPAERALLCADHEGDHARADAGARDTAGPYVPLLGDGPSDLAVWTAVEALTKLANGRLLSPAGRPRLTSLRPPLAAGVSLTHRCLGDLTCCVATPSPTDTP